MPFEDIKAQIIQLLDDMVNQPQDSHQLAESVRESLNELKASGMPLPQDLVELEKQLEAQFELKGKTVS